MKAATVHQIKAHLKLRSAQELSALILRLAVHKKENKELLSYLLFDAQDEDYYIAQIKAKMDIAFSEINKTNLYFAKKGIRKVLKMIDKHIRFSKIALTETELRIYFCELIQSSRIPIHRSRVLLNLFNNQIKKIDKSMAKMHVDVQFDFLERLENIR